MTQVDRYIPFSWPFWAQIAFFATLPVSGPIWACMMVVVMHVYGEV